MRLSVICVATAVGILAASPALAQTVVITPEQHTMMREYVYKEKIKPRKKIKQDNEAVLMLLPTKRPGAPDYLFKQVVPDAGPDHPRVAWPRDGFVTNRIERPRFQSRSGPARRSLQEDASPGLTILGSQMGDG